MSICNVLQEDDTEMDVDAAAPATQISIKHGLPEIEIYCYLLVLIFLIDQKKYADTCSTWVRLGQFSWSTLMLKKASSKLLGRHPHQLVVFVFSATNGLSL